MRIALSSYSLSHKHKYQSMMDLVPYPAKVKEMGFDGIEFSLHFPLTEEDCTTGAKALRRACDDAGIPCVAVCTGANFLRNDMAEEVLRLQRYVEVAAVLGAPILRHDAAYGPSPASANRTFAAALTTLAEGCRQVTAFAQGLGVKTCVENHGHFVQDSDRVIALCEAVAHENFGLLVDIGNFLCADEAPALAVAAVAPYAIHAHIKDFHYKPGTQIKPGNGWFQSRGGHWLRGAIVGHGDVPVCQCLRLLANAGYDGYVSIEFEGLEDVDFAVTDGLANLRARLPECTTVR